MGGIHKTLGAFIRAVGVTLMLMLLFFLLANEEMGRMLHGSGEALVATF
jgi:hypothetical protein